MLASSEDSFADIDVSVTDANLISNRFDLPPVLDTTIS